MIWVSYCLSSLQACVSLSGLRSMSPGHYYFIIWVGPQDTEELLRLDRDRHYLLLVIVITDIGELALYNTVGLLKRTIAPVKKAVHWGGHGGWM